MGLLNLKKIIKIKFEKKNSNNLIKKVDVVVDDRLPFDSSNGRIVFANNIEQPNEYWVI
jgi:hypothetical protein